MVYNTDILFEPVKLRHTTLPNRFVRSATYEGAADSEGAPNAWLANLYKELVNGGVGTIFSGFVYVAPEGRAMQPRQCGIDSDSKIKPWRSVVERARKTGRDARLIMQLAHVGRQTRKEVTGMPVVGVASKKCSYFKQKVKALNDSEINRIIQAFGDAARRARAAGFDGVQVHAAHGYLIHQFLSPWTNNRSDKWADGKLFLEEIMRNIRQKAGNDFPVFVKVSWGEHNRPGLNLQRTIKTVRRLKEFVPETVEVSYGSMEYAFNIIRGKWPLDTVMAVNPLFNNMPRLVASVWMKIFSRYRLQKFRPFSFDYNLKAAREIKQATDVPVIPVGGIRTVDSMVKLIEEGFSAVSLCRPLICEPDLPAGIRSKITTASSCTNCNLCTVYCDTNEPTMCRKEPVKY
ncbi:MAG: NADH:flavin oxidoreductase [Lentisphaeria bacterium]